MRPWFRSLVIVLAAACAVSVAGGGCAKNPPTVLMLALSSEPGTDQIDIVDVEVDHAGSQFLYPFDLAKQKLPGTMAIVLNPTGDAKPGDPVTIIVSAQGKTSAKIERTIQTSFVEEKVKFLPVTLRFACLADEDSDPCALEQTCINGSCMDATLDPATLVDFSDAYVFGKKGSSSCFDPTTCFSSADPAHMLVAEENLSLILRKNKNCQIDTKGAFPQLSGLSNLDRAKMNIGIHWPEDSTPGRLTVLDQSSLGWTFQGDLISFEEGLCTKLKSELDHSTKLSIGISDLCKPKTPLTPVCSD